MARKQSLTEYLAFRAFRGMVRMLPRPLCLALGRGLGDLAYALDGRHRRLAQANLRTAFGGALAERARRRIARDSFRHFGATLFDTFKLSEKGPDGIAARITVEGGEHLRAALREGKGVLLFTAHFGNWEVGSVPIARTGRLNVVARALDNAFLEKELSAVRTGLGAEVIYKTGAARPILQALARNEIVAILMDQNVLRSQAVFVDFFGKPAATTPAPASFHLRTGAPLLPAFCVPGPPLDYRLTIHPPLRVRCEGDPGRDMLKITQACTKMIEDAIRERPGLWLWFHNRWKSRPAGAPSGAKEG
ncbi:MAG: lysophospholipid acyltransferase family protein [Candidatus Aminicenantes bacterium]|nr:lysophospholipid acyltransferase family protein [Candidatus Aminicenantes bacterium]